MSAPVSHLVSVDGVCLESYPCVHECTFADGHKCFLHAPSILTALLAAGFDNFPARTVDHFCNWETLAMPEVKSAYQAWHAAALLKAPAYALQSAVHMSGKGTSTALRQRVTACAGAQRALYKITDTGAAIGTTGELFLLEGFRTSGPGWRSFSVFLNDVVLGVWFEDACSDSRVVSIGLGITLAGDTRVRAVRSYEHGAPPECAVYALVIHEPVTASFGIAPCRRNCENLFTSHALQTLEANDIATQLVVGAESPVTITISNAPHWRGDSRIMSTVLDAGRFFNVGDDKSAFFGLQGPASASAAERPCFWVVQRMLTAEFTAIPPPSEKTEFEPPLL